MHFIGLTAPSRPFISWRADREARGMDGTGGGRGASTAAEPVWTIGAGRWQAAWRGARETPPIPALILSLSFVGFGALTNETGLTLLHTLLMSVFIFALPGQVVLVDEMARGATILTAGAAVTATAVRLLPMTVALLPLVRERGGPKWLEFLVAYYVAITVWVEAMRRSPLLPRRLRGAYTLGIAAALICASSAGATAGFLLAANVPKIFAAALLFITPIYFLLSMLASSRAAADIMPILAGLILAPLLHLVFPQWDLLLTGLVGGTLSFMASRWMRGRPVP
jgi:predicted branched-subunit amino acid permease